MVLYGNTIRHIGGDQLSGLWCHRLFLLPSGKLLFIAEDIALNKACAWHIQKWQYREHGLDHILLCQNAVARSDMATFYPEYV